MSRAREWVVARGFDRDAEPDGQSDGNGGPGGRMMGTAGFDTIFYCNLERNKHPKREKQRLG
jgi:hypothetical protein